MELDTQNKIRKNTFTKQDFIKHIGKRKTRRNLINKTHD